MFCVSLAKPNISQVCEQIEKFSEITDLFEIRIDSLENLSKDEILKVFSYPFRFIFTLRTYREGGKAQLSPQSYIDWILWALQQPFYLVDVEWRYFKRYYEKFNLTTSFYDKYDKILVSYHNFNRTPEKGYLKRMLREMGEKGVKKAKIVTMAKVFEDSLRLLDVIRFAKELGIELITFGMGEAGRLSRVLCLLAGSPFTYVAPSKEEAVAPGQIDLLTAKTIYSNLLDHLPKPS
ncbi:MULTISPECIES: type I 3-dehydroquinate dehydratase [Thermodesulfobacterium]|jgi:3-dehydroquinate dehydratase-1|uniref:type I 3-dehydroquinate dehydratase n=1 Tax=Thermodesulfobacterium TaxID=1740 RepID=UPI00068DE431|nr:MULTISPECIES: type I 3-dehydroquinate dehydratase [Thermodesulfobacterium]MBZ4681918.1 aroD [Thermodesulfobacterium sp.]MDN5379457.1 3-dehydroquinate dehydratase [Thermodesulfobacterium sp.]